MTHLGPRLSALIDGELEDSERMRVFDHIGRCRPCRDEVDAIRTLKRKLNALGEAAAGAGLAGRLMGLSEQMDDSGMRPGGAVWPPPPPPSSWHADGGPSQGGTSANRNGHQDQRAARFFMAGSVAIFLAGLGTAAVIAGGEPQARAPAPPVTPSIDVLVAPHTNSVNQAWTGGPGTGVIRRGSRDEWSQPDVDSTFQPSRP